MPVKARTFKQCQSRQCRPTAARRGYGYAWEKLSRWYRRRHPLCFFCQRATELVDHIRPISQGGAILDLENLRPACRVCHAALTTNLKLTGVNEMPMTSSASPATRQNAPAQAL